MTLYQLDIGSGVLHITRRIIATSPVQAICAFLRTTSKEELDALKGAPLHIVTKPLGVV